MRSVLRLLLLLLVSVLVVGKTYCQTIEQPIIKVLDGALGQIAQDSSIMVEDAKWWDSTERAKLDSNGLYRIRNIMSLKINEDTALVYQSRFAANLRIRIFFTRKNGIEDSTDQNLSIAYDSTQGSTYNSQNIFSFEGAYRVNVRILSVDSSYLGDSSTATPWPFMSLVRLENEMQITREYNFACSPPSAIWLNIDSSLTSTTGEYRAFWQDVPGATEYDLEWAFVDQSAFDEGLYSTSGSPDPKKIFDNNATRVTVTQTEYQIPLLYDDEGYLFVRYRPVQSKPSLQRYEGNWSSDNSAGLAQCSFGGHQPTMNWQATTSYAEDGKRKSVVQYFDGTMRSRQTVTKDNTTNTTIVAETLYDFQGRPTIQVLPAPTLSSIIAYTPVFNVATDIYGDTVEYQKNLYDSLVNPTDFCDAPAPPMDPTLSGASLYYSPYNPAASGYDYHQYIPDAQGYVFTETRYTQDNTGRIQSQGGVGVDHIIGSGHETKYYYGNPDQGELDALFGSEAGDASHYFKNMVRDANGQYSVSYVDMHGRTIATALAGQAPATMDTLPSYNTRTVTEKISRPNNNIIYDHVMESSRSILVPQAGNYFFDYELNPDSLHIQSCDSITICYDCLYNLEITLTDDCNNCRLPGQQPYVVVDSNFTFAYIDTTCGGPAFFRDTFSIQLGEGNYTVTKKLSISQFGHDYYRDSVFLIKNTCKTFQDFYNEQMDSIQSQLDCGQPTCDSCSAHTSSYAAYKSYYLRISGLAVSDTAQYADQIQSAYQDALDECHHICNGGDENEYRKMMLADMTPPMGQYANPDSASNANNAFNIFAGTDMDIWRSVTYYDELGKKDSIMNSSGMLVPPTDASISQEEFISGFKDSWANALLSHHPEYDRLIMYESYPASTAWDQRFLNIDTYSSANALGYLDPTGSTTKPSSISNLSTDRDPLSSAGTYSYPPLMAVSYSMNSDVVNFRTKNVDTVYSMWGVASLSAKCGQQDNACAGRYRNTTLNNCFDAGFCTGDLDMGWRTFRNLYYTEKRRLFMQYITDNYPVTIPQYHFEHFAASASMDTYVPGTNPATIGAYANAQIQAFYNQNCQSYATYWFHQLAPCNFTSADSIHLIPRLIQICEAGSDGGHPFGASSTAPGSTLTYTSFEGLIKHYADSLNTIDPGTYPAYGVRCYADLIQYPEKYDEQSSLSDIPIWTKPDSCQCSTISGLHNRYLQTGLAFSSFSSFIFRETGTTVSDADLTKLLNMCSGIDTCKFLVTPITLPPALQCNVHDVCVSCAQFAIAYDSFKVVFGGVTPDYGDNDTDQHRINVAFTNYMNNKLGFSKELTEYLHFMDSCSAVVEDTIPVFSYGCDSLKEALRQYYLSGFAIGHAADGSQTGVWTPANSAGYINHDSVCYPDFWSHFTMRDFMDTGIIKGFPDTMTCYPGDYAIQYKIPLCLGNEFSIETRIRVKPGADYTVAQLYIEEGFEHSWELTEFTANSFYNGFEGDYPMSGYPSFGDWKDSATMHLYFPDWRKVKITFKNNMIYCYVDDTLRGSTFYPGNFSQIRSFLIGGWYQIPVQIDWVKLYDGNNNLRMQEDFNDYTNFTTPPYDWICPDVSCSSAFPSFFNSRFGTSYTYDQILGIYKNQCNINFEPCGPPTGPMLCGKNEPLFPEVTPPNDDPCADSTDLAFIKATSLYEAYVDSLKSAFDSAYYVKCMQAFKTESFTVTHPQSEYHYTLYYYDQSGNLVKTVPPAGVDLSKFSEALWSDSVQAARDAETLLTPDHWLQTNYRYNSLNQVVADSTPDAGLSHKWYDRLGRIVVSQNAKQKDTSAYSYTIYDYLGRPNEVGQITASEVLMNDAISRDTTLLSNWFAANASTKEQVTRTYYDIGYSFAPLSAANLRNRVAYTTYTEDNSTTAYNSATFYSYDIHGNVDTLVQDYGNSLYKPNIMNSNANRWKWMVYNYDLISGKVNSIAYQPNQQDAFYHRYTYDAENRLTIVETSKDSLVWETDARYSYYKHGPLARTVLGQQLVQGVDYAYTLQGWLKGINSDQLLPTQDMGNDAIGNYVAKDAYGLNLNYFDGDYSAISGLTPFSVTSDNAGDMYRPLYNGNINSMVVNVAQLSEPLLYAYKYDQLNRITGMQSYYFRSRLLLGGGGLSTGDSSALRSLSLSGVYLDAPSILPVRLVSPWELLSEVYSENFAYDPNGNILSLQRTADRGSYVMDSLTYKYNYDANGRLLNNRLDHVNDSIPASAYPDDVDDQPMNNYAYDKTGNTTMDSLSGLSNMVWNVYGKLAKVIKGDNTITYTYDPGGQRISKTVTNNITNISYTIWYVRDASGNLMSTYHYKGVDPVYQADVYKYGITRLGTWTTGINTELAHQTTDTVYDLGSGMTALSSSFTRGLQQYELTDHRSNVLVTISDKKTAVWESPICPPGFICDITPVLVYYPDVITAQDSYSAGMIMKGRSYNSSQYNHFINGQLKEPELNDNISTAQFWEYDSRIVRRWNIDPKPNDWTSSYACFAGNPICFQDVLGDTFVLSGERGGKDGEADVISYLSRLGKATGNTYALNDKGNVVRTNKNLNTRTTDKVSGELSKQIDYLINSNKKRKFTIANSDESDKEIQFDNALSSRIDLRDMNNVTDPIMFAGMTYHFYYENSLLSPDPTKRTILDAQSAHSKALIKESEVMGQMFGLNLSTRREIWGKPDPVLHTVIYTWDYGKVQYQAMFRTRDIIGTFIQRDVLTGQLLDYPHITKFSRK